MQNLRVKTAIRRFRGLAAWFAMFAVSSGHAADTVHVSCVGNSITDGTGLAGRDTACYPARLQQMLGPGYNVLNCGVAGATILKNGNKPYWTFGQAGFGAAMAFTPKVVIIELGTNDSKSSGGVDNWPSHKDEFVGDYEAMVDTFAALTSRPKVWACYPTPAYSTAYLIDSMVLHYEILPKIKTVALNRGIPLIDLFAAMSNQPSLFADGIHPTAAGYVILARKVFQMLTKDTLTIIQQKNRLEAPQNGALYQWYWQDKPVAALSGGTGQVLTARDTGLYKVSVGQSATTDDILVSSVVHVGLPDLVSDVSRAAAPAVSRAVKGFVRLFRPNGELASSLFVPATTSFERTLPHCSPGVYFAITETSVFRVLIP
jgi:acyl-CoA thioesterase I